MRLRHLGKRALINTRWCLRGGPLVTLLDDNFPGAFDRFQCIFIHIPKAAGSSVALSLFGHQTGHRKYLDYLRENHRKTRRYFKFTFVRNPWDRLVSAYHFLRAGGMNEQDREWGQQHLARFATFDEFVVGWLNEENIRRQSHFEPQYKFLVGYGSNDVKADFVGHVEHFDCDFRTICERLGVNCQPRRMNQSRHKEYRSCYTDRSIEIVRRVYERDIALFGYDFDDASVQKEQFHERDAA